MLDLKFDELKCPRCQSKMISGNTQTGLDVRMVKRCGDGCGFWMIIIVPHDDFDYMVEMKRKNPKSTKFKPQP